MKRIFFSALIGLSASFGVSAADGDTFTFQGLDYIVLSESDLTCEVGPNADNASGDVVIPSTVSYDGKDYTVTALGTDAFALDLDITSISIPETVTLIRSGALMKMMKVTELVVPNSVTEIESRGVFGNWKLEKLTISSSLRTIHRETFSGNKELLEIVIPEGVEVIESEAFNYCAAAKSLTLANTVTSIGKMAFAGLSKLPEVTIPASVNEVGEEAFSYCYLLSTVTLESSETPLRFGINAFGQGLYADNPFDNPVAKIVTLNLNRPWTCASTEINEMPFTKKSRLETVNIGAEVTSLPANTFANCDQIKAVNIDSETCPAAETDCFTSTVYTNATLSVPEKAVEAYKAHSVWSKFANIEGVKGTEEDPNPNEKPDEPDGIETVNTNAVSITGVYDLNGRVVTEVPSHGLYIMRMSDGTVKKVLVK